MTKPSQEELALQMELQKVQNAHRMDKEEYDSQKQATQEQLQREVGPCCVLNIGSSFFMTSCFRVSCSLLCVCKCYVAAPVSTPADGGVGSF